MRIWVSFCLMIVFSGGMTNVVTLPSPVYAQVMEDVRIEALQGSYRVFGRNPNGQRYAGKLQITVRDGLAFFQWQIGQTQYSGVGKLTGNVLVVNWGNSPPVIYTIDVNGNLAGTWDNGKASERLIKDTPV